MIEITPAARTRMHEFLHRHPDSAGIRFGAKRTGCSGFGYVVELADAIGDGDRTLEVDGVKLVIDAKSLPLLDGTRIDFRRQGINASFVFENPNATGGCGCGESFTVDTQGA